MVAPHMSRTIKATLLLLLLVICGSAFLVAHKVSERATPPAPRELFTVVNQQLNAFRSADFQSAYRYAATGLQQRFTLRQFEEMVRHNYPEMTRADRVEFGLVKMQGTSAVVQVFFFADDGAVRSFIYSLTNESNAWKIDGVQESKGYRTNDRLTGSHA